MKFPTISIVALASALALTGCATDSYASSYASNADSPASRVVSKVDTSIGDVFATTQGMTLYTFTRDEASVSNCYDGCAASWPPFSASKDAETWGAFTVIERSDGSYQWAYDNQPLYTWVGDRQRGDVNGHEVSDVWYAAQPGR
ncbi:COG4315 family predicted lipoprotein [Saccharospirillum impatiens]|uniref:COG4315 family predicted lipoprotein n=1 Tax=Saccharospirillum impatiens TaxID=169438 RepID=UPI00042793E9|nr:hypothetical protein [Saccharospirillum impatiens]